MDEPRIDLCSGSLVAALEANFFAFLPFFGCVPESRLREEPDVTWFRTPLNSTLFNQVVRSRFPTRAADRRIQEILRAYTTENLPLLWWVTPSSGPADLEARLCARGFLLEERWPGMAVDLDGCRAAEPPPKDLEFEEVHSPEQLQTWLGVFCRGFHVEPWCGEHFFETWSRRDLGPSPAFRYLLARLNGEPVATSLLFLRSGVAGLYCITTRVEARRQGIGRAITLAAMRSAREVGYRTAVLQAGPMAQAIYERIGFREVCKFSYYFCGMDENA